MAKRLLITSTDLMMVQFLLPHVISLSKNGFEIEIACSDVGGRMDEIRSKLKGIVKRIHTVRLKRSPAAVINLKGYGDMKHIIDQGHYDIIWTNEPVMGVVTRLAAKKSRKNGTKVLYMVHGFHFFEGAPKLNWVVYYPIERFMAPWADVVCTVNREDYKRAQTMQIDKVEYIHGIGINTDRLTSKGERGDIRKELGLKANDFIVLSVGELNKNKNQKTIIKALACLKDPKVHYLICGKGDQLEDLKSLAKSLGISDNVHFLGYRKDVVDICSQADVFAMPSYREGLPVASLEAMYCGLPLVTSNIRGLVDVMENGRTGYMCRPDDVKGFAKAVNRLRNDAMKSTEMGRYNRERVQPYCLKQTITEVSGLLNRMA